MRLSRVIITGLALAFVGAIAISFSPVGKSARADNDDRRNIQVVPYTFIGKAGDCGTGYPAGSRIVTSAWLPGFGLPDDGTTANGVPASANMPHSGLLLSKNGPETDCSAAGAHVTDVKGMKITATFELGFDSRIGTHCSGGAPRFDVVTSDNVDHFVGSCSNGAETAAPQDSQWTRDRFVNPMGWFPPAVPGTTIKSIDIVFDEGTDIAGPPTKDPNGVGLANIDNIDVNGRIITHGPSQDRCDDRGHGGDRANNHDDCN